HRPRGCGTRSSRYPDQRIAMRAFLFSLDVGIVLWQKEGGCSSQYVQGVSTRSVDELVKAMGMSGISKSQVSRLCAEIDERVHAFLERPIEGDWPYLWIDATYLKVREAGRIVSVAVIIAVAVNTD